MKNIYTKEQYFNEHVSLDNVKLNGNFWKWFGDSKVIGKMYNPLVCYHGTPNGGFAEFSPKIGQMTKSKQQVDLGSHFSIDKDYARRYAIGRKAPKIYEVFLRIENPLHTNKMFYKEDDEQEFNMVFEFVTKFFNIRVSGDVYYNKIGEKQNEPQCIMLNSFMIDDIPPNKLYNGLLEFGFDGVFHEPYNRVDMYQFKKHPPAYIILEPNQVKSIENDGSWDINDNNIYS